MSKLAYMRVSSEYLSIQNQKQVLEKYGIEKYFEDDAKSGKLMEDRDGVRSLLDYVREGDFVYIVALDRLVRNRVD